MNCCSLHKLAHAVSGHKGSKSTLISLSPHQVSQLPLLNYNSLYEFGPNQEVLANRPWKNLPKYFTQVLVSALALVKMSVHAKMGGSIEVMGMLTGKIVRNTIVVMDVYSLPVEGTETRVNAQNEAYEYMVQYLDLLKSVGREENIVGWYHSHPGYGCWLSGIDVATQSLNQNFQDPYLAIVVDPILTVNQGKVDIGAFRTFPMGYTTGKKPENTVDTKQIKSKGKKHDFGAHADQYYALDIKFFRSSSDEALIDAILNKSWVSHLIQATNSRQEYDKRLASKVDTLLAIKRESIASPTRQLARLNASFENLMQRAADEQEEAADSTDVDDRMSIEESAPPAYGSDEAEDDDDDDGDEEEDDDDDDDDDNDDEDGDDEVEESRRCRSSSSTEVPDSAEDKNVKKRGLRTSSEESKLNLYFEPSQTRTRKRFATGDTGTALSNEFRYKMQAAQAELKRQLRNLSKVGHSELVQLISAKTRHHVFGGLSQ